MSMAESTDKSAGPSGVSGVASHGDLYLEIAQLKITLRGLLAFYDTALGYVTLDAGDELIVDGTRVSNIVSLIEMDESVRFDAALDAAEPHAEAARALLGGDQS